MKNNFVIAHSLQISIDPTSCVFCGICEIFCPFNAIKLYYVNNNLLKPDLKRQPLPKLLRGVKVDEETCMRVNLLCERLCLYACPLDLIRFDRFHISIERAEDCPACGWCQSVCRSVIKVKKAFIGTIKINREKCPEGCKNCFYACPVNAICLDENGNVMVLEDFCIFCGACKNYCPESGAIDISVAQINVSEPSVYGKIAERLQLYAPARVERSLGKNFAMQWPKVFVEEDCERLRIERRTYVQRYVIELDKKKCRKCQLCYIVCPKAAITIQREKR